MKRLLTFIIAVAVACSLTGCKQSEPPTPPKETIPSGVTAQVQMSHSYRAQEILAAEDLGFTKFYQFSDKVLTYTPPTITTAVIGIYSPDTEEFVRKEFENTDMLGVSVQGDLIEVMLRVVNRDTYTSSYLCKTYDSSMNEVSSADLSEIWGEDASGWSWAKDMQGNEYMAVNTKGIVCCNADGKVALIPKTDGNATLYTGRDGSVYAICDRRTIMRLTADVAEEIPLELPRVGGNRGELLPGNAQYDALCYTTEYLYGIIFADGSAETLLSWQESDLLASTDRLGTLLLPDGRILTSAWDDPTLNTLPTLYLLTARTQEEVDSMKLITLGDVSSPGTNSWVEKLVCKYNRQAEGCRIVTKNYWDENTSDFGTDALTQDLLDGIVPDILCSIPDYRMFSEKGLFEDLSFWMENDPDFHEDEYFMNFFKSLKYKDRLECIGFQFAVDTYAAKAEFLGGTERLTLADYANLTLPDGMEVLSSADRVSAFEWLMSSQLSEFVDYENASCTFDSEEFISLLKWFSTFPEQAAVSDDYAYRENRALLCPTQIGSLQNYHRTVQCQFGNADVTLTGTPIHAEGNGGVFATLGLLAVSSTSEYKEEVWDFIKFCLSAEVQSNKGAQSYGFPVNLKALKNVMDAQVSGTEKLPSVSFGGEMVQLTPPTEQEAAQVREYLKGVTFCSYLDDPTIKNIVEEETAKCFAGDCTAEDAAKIIQGRVSLYLAEQY